MQGSCNDCVFWDNTKFFDDTKGLCKFNAPIFSSDNKTRWPVTREQDWCGRFEFIDKKDRDRDNKERNRGRSENRNRGKEGDRDRSRDNRDGRRDNRDRERDNRDEDSGRSSYRQKIVSENREP